MIHPQSAEGAVRDAPKAYGCGRRTRFCVTSDILYYNTVTYRQEVVPEWVDVLVSDPEKARWALRSIRAGDIVRVFGRLYPSGDRSYEDRDRAAKFQLHVGSRDTIAILRRDRSEDNRTRPADVDPNLLAMRMTEELRQLDRADMVRELKGWRSELQSRSS